MWNFSWITNSEPFKTICVALFQHRPTNLSQAGACSKHISWRTEDCGQREACSTSRTQCGSEASSAFYLPGMHVGRRMGSAVSRLQPKGLELSSPEVVRVFRKPGLVQRERQRILGGERRGCEMVAADNRAHWHSQESVKAVRQQGPQL